jgi:hypothetical protein
MPERSRHRVSEAQDGRSERLATGHGQPLTVAHERSVKQRFPEPEFSRLSSGKPAGVA